MLWQHRESSMDDRKPSSTQGGTADQHGAARRVQQFLASFKRRVQPSPAGATCSGEAAQDKPTLRSAPGSGSATE